MLAHIIAAVGSRRHLKHLYDQLKVDAMILQFPVAALHVIELLAPVDFEACAFLRQDDPTESDPDAGKRLKVWGLSFGAPCMSKIDKLRKLQPVFSGGKPEQVETVFQ